MDDQRVLSLKGVTNNLIQNLDQKLFHFEV